MKKITMVIFLFLLLIVTGCGKNKKLVCKLIQEFEAGYTVETKVSTTFEDGLVEKEVLTITMTFEEESVAKSSYQNLLDQYDEKNTSITINGSVITLEEVVDHSSDENRADRSEFLGAYQEDGYICE